MQRFLLVFESLEPSLFETTNNLRNHLDIACKGKYSLKVLFRSLHPELVKKYNLRGAPALIALNKNQIAYGKFKKKENIKDLLL